MADQIGKGVFELTTDATGFKAGIADAKQAQADFARSSAKTAKTVGDSVAKVGEAAAGATEQAAERAQGEINKLDANAKRLATTIRRLGEQAGIPRSQYLENRAKQLNIFGQPGIEASLAKIRQSEQAVAKVGLTAKQTAQAMRLLPAQITDIVTGLASGQPAYLVAIQQGGQLKDSFGGIVPAARALLSIFTPLRLAIGGVAGAALLLAVAYKQGSAEIDAYNRALIMTGNIAGMTAGQLQSMAATIAASSRATQGQAAEAIAALAGAGVTKNLEQNASVVIETNKRLGTSVEDIVKQYVELGKDPVKASQKLNETQKYLTLAIYEQIKALEEQGRIAEAGELAQKAYADAQKERNRQLEASLGDYQRAWERLGDAARKAWDWMMNGGREPEPQQALADAQARLDFMQRKGPGGGFGQFAQEEVDQQKALVETLKQKVDQVNGLAAAQGRYNKINHDAIAAEQRLSKYTPKADERKNAIAQFNKDIEAYQLGRRLNKLPELTDAEIAARRKVLLDKFADKKTGSSKDDAATRMLQKLRETEASLTAQLDTESKLGAAAQARVEFEQMIADLKDKKTLTADQKSLLANEKEITSQLEKNEALEKEAAIRELIRKKVEEQRKAENDFFTRSEQLQQQLAESRQGRQEQYERQINAFGRSDAARTEIEAQTAIYREYQRAMSQLLKTTPPSLLGSKEYADEAAKIKSQLDGLLEDHHAYYDRLRIEQSQWANGMSRALSNYVDDAANAAEQSEQLWTGTFKSAEDALTKFVSTGKFSFSDLADFVLVEINRMIIRMQVLAPIARALRENDGGILGTLMGGLFGTRGIGAGTAGTAASTAYVPVPGGGFAPAIAKGAVVGQSGFTPFEDGGIVRSPMLFGYAGGRRGLLGEAGYEAIMPVARGPDGKLGVKTTGAGAPMHPMVVNINLPNVTDYEGFRRSESQIKNRVIGWSAGGRRIQ